MNELSAPAVARICEHMNDDHADALASFARHYAKLEGVVRATLVALDRNGLDLEVECAHGRTRARVPFPSPLRDADDARDVLVAMAREAAAPP